MPRSRTADAGRDAPASERQGAASRRVRNVRATEGRVMLRHGREAVRLEGVCEVMGCGAHA
jgi:hypothetical protein